MQIASAARNPLGSPPMHQNDLDPTETASGTEITHREAAVQGYDALELELRTLERDLARNERDRFARIVAHVGEVLHGPWPAEAKIRNLTDYLDGLAPEKTPERGAGGA